MIRYLFELLKVTVICIAAVECAKNLKDWKPIELYFGTVISGSTLHGPLTVNTRDDKR